MTLALLALAFTLCFFILFYFFSHLGKGLKVQTVKQALLI